jgi:hypothetical protein
MRLGVCLRDLVARDDSGRVFVLGNAPFHPIGRAARFPVMDLRGLPTADDGLAGAQEEIVCSSGVLADLTTAALRADSSCFRTVISARVSESFSDRMRKSAEIPLGRLHLEAIGP